MKELFYIEDTLENKISYYHLVFFLIALPFDAFYGDIILISFAIHTFIHIREDHLPLLLSKQVLLMASLYLLGLAGLLYSRNKQEGLYEISKQLPFLLFPLLFALTNLNLEKYKINLFKVVGFSCVFIILFLFADSLQIIWYFHLPFLSLFQNEFINQNFSEPASTPATFLSVYAVFAVVVFLFLCSKEKLFSNKFLYCSCIVILLAGLIQLSSRAVFIALLCIIFIPFPFFLLKGKKRIKFIAVALVITLGIFFIISQVSSFNRRYISEFKDDLTLPSISNEIKEPRIIRWKAELELIKESPIIGYGTGSERTVLEKKYFDEHLYYSYLHGFDAHNQYLAFLIGFGVVGLTIYLCILLYAFFVAIKTKDIFFISALILIAVVSVSEEIMTFSHGRMFYSFFIAFFLGMYKQDKVANGKLAEATLQ
jgi:O-antigen ligase